MADSAPDLPSNQRILICRIVADYQNGLRLVQLLHGKQGIGGAISQSDDQPSVISGAMMVDVVGSKGCACEPLQQVIFFIRRAVRTDEADRILAASVVSGFQLGRRRLRSLFPGNSEQLVALAHERLTNALGMAGEIKAE